MSSLNPKPYGLAARREFYKDFCKYAKAPPLRRAIAVSLDLALAAVPTIYTFLWTQSYFVILPMIVYLLVRDALVSGRSPGKALMRLVVVHKDTLAPCTLRQSLIRNSLYATICPIFLAIGVIAIGWLFLFLSVMFLIKIFAGAGITSFFFLGYDPNNGRTIPDSWAETHVLTPKEVAIIVKLRHELEGKPSEPEASEAQVPTQII